MGRFFFMGKEFDSFKSCDVFIVYKAFMKTELLENEIRITIQKGFQPVIRYEMSDENIKLTFST